MKRPLGKFETAQVLTGEAAPFNLVIVLRMSKGPGFEVLQRALGYLHQRHPMLRAGIERHDGKFYFTVADVAKVCLRQNPRTTDDDWKGLVEDELNTPFSLMPGPLFRVTYVASSERQDACELVLTAHHAIIDGVSAACLLHELLGLCESLSAGLPLDKPSSLCLFDAAEHLFPASHQGLRGVLAQTVFLGQQMRDGYRFWRGIRNLDEPGIMPEGQCRIISFQLPSGLTTRLNRICRKQRITLNSLLCAVQLLLTRDHAFNGESVPLRHFVFADLRPYLQPSIPAENLGAYFAMLHLVSGVNGDTGPWSLACSLNAQIHDASTRGDKFNSVLMSKFLMKTILAKPRFRMGHAALAFLGPVKLSANYGEIKPTGLHAFVSNMVLGPVYTANVRIFMKQLYWDMIYLDSDMDKATATRLADTMLNTLTRLAQGAEPPANGP